MSSEQNFDHAPAVLPVLALRGLVLFPEMVLHFDVGRKKSILALNAAMNGNQTIFLVPQLDLGEDDPAVDHLSQVGVVHILFTNHSRNFQFHNTFWTFLFHIL